MSNIFHALHEIDKPGFALNSVFFIQKRRFVVKVTEALTFSKSRNKDASILFEKLRESSSTLLECELEPPNGSCYQEKRIHSLRAYFDDSHRPGVSPWSSASSSSSSSPVQIKMGRFSKSMQE